MLQDDKRSSQKQHEDDVYVEALDCFKKRSFATFGVVIFLMAMSIAVIVEAAGVKKIWDSVFAGAVHAEHVQPPPCQAQ